MKDGAFLPQRKQWKVLEEFSHGEEKVKPLQISMLVKGLRCYADLYLFEPSVVLKKKSKKPNDNLYLKKKNSLDDSRNYISGKDITVKDLEKMYKNSKQLATGRPFACNGHLSYSIFLESNHLYGT